MKPTAYLFSPTGKKKIKMPKDKQVFTDIEMAEMFGRAISFTQCGENKILCFSEDVTLPINPLTTPARRMGLLDNTQSIHGNAMIADAELIVPMLLKHKIQEY